MVFSFLDADFYPSLIHFFFFVAEMAPSPPPPLSVFPLPPISEFPWFFEIVFFFPDS